MAAENGSNSFASGRANLRETAKWMVSAIVGAATLIVGSSTISKFGSLPLLSTRFIFGAVALILAAGLCWIPFTRAIAVLRSELLSLKQFATAKKGECKEAADEVSQILGRSLPQHSDLREFENLYSTVRDNATNATGQEHENAQKKLADLEPTFQIVRDACVAQLVVVRFKALERSLAFPGAIILIAFSVFAWAANPPDVQLLKEPRTAKLTTEDVFNLKGSKIEPACFGPQAQLVQIAESSDSQTAVLMGPNCNPHKVVLSAGRWTVPD